MITSLRHVSRRGAAAGRRLGSSRRRLPASSSVGLRRLVSNKRFYTTERVLELRSGKKKEDQPKVLYDPKNEKENCGVGLIASLKTVPSRDIVVKADEMLVRMAHRGGVGSDPASGDGSGKCNCSRTKSGPRLALMCVV